MNLHHNDWALNAIADADPIRGLDQQGDLDLGTLLNEADERTSRVPRSHRRRATGVVALAGILAVGGAAAATDLLDGPAPDVAGIVCQTKDSGSVIKAVVQSPIMACAEHWRAHGDPVPTDPVMYQTPGQVVTVSSRGLMPVGAHEITHIPAADIVSAEVEDILQDRFHLQATGHSCAPPAMQDYLAGALHKAAITTISLDTSGIGNCTRPAYDRQTHTVNLDRGWSTRERTAEPLQPQEQHLADHLATACTTSEVNHAIDTYIRSNRLAPQDYQLQRIPAAGGACARAYLIPGGLPILHVYEP